MTLTFLNEFQIDTPTSMALNTLLQKSFPEVEYEGRDYFKQLPHYRILAKEGEQIIGQMGIDFRVMNLNGKVVNVFGVVALCVDSDFQGKGIGTKLMLEFEAIAKRYPNRIDALFLVTDLPQYYERLGYKTSTLHITWLKIHQHQNYGLGKELITDVYFMYKMISDKVWEDGELDLLGYMY
ncbi:MAG: GNAT family N-acetyltransferase [Chitinophagales bacterium]